MVLTCLRTPSGSIAGLSPNVLLLLDLQYVFALALSNAHKLQLNLVATVFVSACLLRGCRSASVIKYNFSTPDSKPYVEVHTALSQWLDPHEIGLVAVGDCSSKFSLLLSFL